MPLCYTKHKNFVPALQFAMRRLCAVPLDLFERGEMVRTVTVGENDAGQRLDKFMSKYFLSMPQSLLYKYIRKKCVRANGKHVKENYQLQAGDELCFYIRDEFFETPPPEQAFLSVTPKLNIVYEDENILLVNKPAGLVVHDDESNTPNTLIAQIQSYLYQKGEYTPERENTFAPALCNRIDRNTEGIVIAAKNAQTLRIMNQKIKDREIRKSYLCLAFGRFSKAERRGARVPCARMRTKSR